MVVLVEFVLLTDVVVFEGVVVVVVVVSKNLKFPPSLKFISVFRSRHIKSKSES